MIAAKSLLVALAALACASAVSAESTVHTVITTECGEYFSWQSMGMLYSHRKAGQPGPLTRIMCCTPEEWEELSEEAKTLMPTHVAPSFTKHPRTGDEYSAYNKPVAVIDWLARNDVKEDFVLIIDADMIMRGPFVPDAEGARPGRAVSAFFGYMKGVSNKLALKHIPEVAPRNDTLAGPKGRRSDMVGGFTMMATADLRRVAPLWLKYTEDVRFDPDAWELSGDAYSTHPGDKPWISEMYGYSYACAKSDVWHITHRSAMLYPGYDTNEPPKVLHYGLYYEIAGTAYKFDKHWHYDFNPFKCPPWKLGKGGLFPHPPAPSSFKTVGDALLRDLMAIEVPVTLNAAFCEHHRANCPASVELERECGRAEALERELDAALAKLEAALPDPCHDADSRCGKWAEHGECDKNMGFMMETCPLACGVCRPRGKRAPAMHRKLGGGGGGVTVTAAGRFRSPPQSVEQVHGRPARVAGRGSRATLPIMTEASGRRSRAQVLESEDLPDALGAEHQVQHRQQVQQAKQARQAQHDPNHLAVGSDGRRISLDDDDDDFEAKGGAGGEEQQQNGQATGSDGDDAEAGGDGGGDGVVSELKLRCTRFPAWSMAQVRRCMAMAAEGRTYDPASDDGDENLHSQAHRLLERTNNMGRLLEEGIKEKVHSAEDAARGMGPGAMLAWGVGLLAAIALAMRRQRKMGKAYHAGRRNFLLMRYGRTEERDD